MLKFSTGNLKTSTERTGAHCGKNILFRFLHSNRNNYLFIEFTILITTHYLCQ